MRDLVMGSAGYSAFLQPDVILVPSSVALSDGPPCWADSSRLRLSPIRTVVFQHGIDDPRQPVGDGDHRDAAPFALQQPLSQLADGILPPSALVEDRLGSLDQQGAQVGVPAPRDAAQPSLLAGGVFAGG